MELADERHEGYMPPESAFLDLPSEIRNTTYALLYEYDEPLHIAEAEDRSGRIGLHCRKDEVNRDGESHIRRLRIRVCSSYVLTPYTDTNAQVVTKKDSDGPEVALFRVYRHVYEEASSVLYKNNTFRFIRSSSLKWITANRGCGFIKRVALPWLEKLASRVLIVRNLILDSGRRCPVRCASYNKDQQHCRNATADRALDFGPLLCMLWKLDVELDLSITRSANHALQSWLSASMRQSPLDHEALSRFVRAIYRDDTDLKEYRRMLGNIRIFIKDIRAMLTFPKHGRLIAAHSILPMPARGPVDLPLRQP
jgi:hypothetical protein